MKLFSPLYARVMLWARHRHAPYYLAVHSFIEAVFWPIPPDVMLAPMALAHPARAWRYALVASFSSVAGASVGYFFGYELYPSVVEPLIQIAGYQHYIELARGWFDSWGIWIIFIASFTPVPFKIFTLTAGLLQMAFLPFILTSLIGRSMRFFLVAGVMMVGGAKMEKALFKWIDSLGWLCIIAIAAAYFVWGR